MPKKNDKENNATPKKKDKNAIKAPPGEVIDEPDKTIIEEPNDDTLGPPDD